MPSTSDRHTPGGAPRGASGPSSPSSEFPDEGLAFGQYRLLSRLSYGGMGEILLAKHEGIGGVSKLLAIKRLLAQHREDKDVVTMFFDEARLQALMRDPHIVQILDMGQIDGHYFIGMELVEGTSWRRLVQRVQDEAAALHPAHAAEMMVQGCRGLRYAHELCDNHGRPLRLVHRDVNPQNLLVTWGGKCKLIDFGIAKSELSGVHTETGTIKGKFAYMSPEQARAEPLDHRSDIFSLGLCLYELLAGENPFRRNNVVQTLGAICEYNPVPLEQLRPEAAALSPIVERCLAKDPDQRFAHCEELEQALMTLLADGLCGVPLSSLESALGGWFAEEIAEQAAFLRRHGFAPTASAGAPREATGIADRGHDVAGSTAVNTPSRRRARQAEPPRARDTAERGFPPGLQDLETRLLGDPVEAPLSENDTHPTARLKLHAATARRARRTLSSDELTGAAAARPPSTRARRWPLLSVAGLALVSVAAWAIWPELQELAGSWRSETSTPSASDTSAMEPAEVSSDTPVIEHDVDDSSALELPPEVEAAAADAGALGSDEPPLAVDPAAAAESDPSPQQGVVDEDVVDEVARPASTTTSVGTARAGSSMQSPRSGRADRPRKGGERVESKRKAPLQAAGGPVEEQRDAAAKPAAALPRGTLTLNAGGPYRISAPGQKGTNVLKVPLVEGELVDLEIGSGPLRVKLRARLRSGAVALAVDTEPWSVVVANNIGRGRTPQRSRVIAGEPLQLLLKNPEAGEMRVTLGYVEANPE